MASGQGSDTHPHHTHENTPALAPRGCSPEYSRTMRQCRSSAVSTITSGGSIFHFHVCVTAAVQWGQHSLVVTTRACVCCWRLVGRWCKLGVPCCSRVVWWDAHQAATSAPGAAPGV